jgi:hypothetical protein
VIAALIGLLMFQTADRLPRFEDFQVAEKFTGTPTTPALRTVQQRRYRTTIRNAAKAGPNFAGHYEVAQTGCGSACAVFFIINVRTGEIFDLPFRGVVFPFMRFPAEGEFGMFDFKVDSRLLVVQGCPFDGPPECASFFYEWTGERLRLLRKLPALDSAQ